MTELGEAVDLVVGRAKGEYLSEIPPNVTLINLDASRMALAVSGLSKYMREFKPERLYSALEEANIIAILANYLSGREVRIYPSLRNTISDEVANKGGIKLRIMVWLARRLYPSVRGIIAVSSGVADDAAQFLRIPREKIEIVPNPTITPDIFERAAATCDHPWLAEGGPPVVLGCGRLAPQKDFATLIRAVARVRRGRPVRLIILGEGPLRGELAALASEIGIADDLSMPGFDPNPFAYMARASVFVLSSVFEGSPNVVVQALALGVPVVSTDCPSGPRELLDGVPSGKLVGIGDPDEMAAAIEALLDPSLPRPAPLELPEFNYRASAAAYLAMDEA
jgi:glycosyltransferase involved in cell wall biosynthesis